MQNTDNNKGTDINSLVGGVETGKPATDPALDAPAGESGVNGKGDFNYEAAYKELEQKMGSQGNELGEYRSFVENITPLLEKLEANPDLVRAIVDGKIDQQLMQSVLSGQVTGAEAEAVTQASAEVTKEVGKGKLESLTPAQIEDLIAVRTNEIRADLEKKADLASFEARTTAFIESTPDFVEHAEAIDKWLDKHDIADIEVAYYAVKGQMSTSAAAKLAEEAAAERQKENMLNAGGGSGYSSTAPDGTNMIDKLVGGSSNPLF